MTKFNYEEFERRLPTNLDYRFGTTSKIKFKEQERLKKQSLIIIKDYFQLLIAYDPDKYLYPNLLDRDIKDLPSTLCQFAIEALYKPDDVPLWSGACLEFDKKSQYSGYMQCYNKQLVDKAEKSKYMIIMDIFDKPNLLTPESSVKEVDNENNEYRCIHLILDLKDEYSLPVLFPLFDELASKGYINYPQNIDLNDNESVSSFFMNMILVTTRNEDRVETVNKHPKDITKDPLTKIVSLYN